MRVDVSYKPIAGLRSFRLMMLPTGPRLVGTVTRYVYDGPMGHMEQAPPTMLPGGDEADQQTAYRRWAVPGFFAFPEAAFNPGYAGGFFPVVGAVSFFGMVVRHAGGSRGQTIRINRLWLAAGRWCRPLAFLYDEPHHARLGIPEDVSAVYFEHPSELRRLTVPPAAGGPEGGPLADELGRTYGCDVDLLDGPISDPAVLERAGIGLAPKAEWKKPLHRLYLLDIPKEVAGRGNQGA